MKRRIMTILSVCMICCCSCGTNEELEIRENEISEIHENYTTANENEKLIEETKNNLAPYFDVMGADITDGNPDVSQEFIDNLNNVSIMGVLGSIEHGWNNINGRQYIELLTWTSNESMAKHEFLEYIELLNDYFGSEMVAGDYPHIAEESYEWIDYEKSCLVLCWYEDSKVNISWDLESDLDVNDFEMKDSEVESDSSDNNFANKQSCEVTGCNGEGIYEIEGISGQKEYYCYKHYKELENMINNMFSDVYN